MFLIDANIVILFNKRGNAALDRRVFHAFDSGAGLVLPSVVRLELEVGVLRSNNPGAARAKLDKFLELVADIVAFDQHDAIAAAEIGAELMNQGRVIGSYDLLIAAQAYTRQAVLVTHNTAEFSRVPGLRLEDWTQA